MTWATRPDRTHWSLDWTCHVQTLLMHWQSAPAALSDLWEYAA